MDLVSGIGGAIGGAIGDAVGGVVKMVTSQVDGILGQFTTGQQELQDMVQKPMTDMLNRLGNERLWEGSGAELFKQDLQSSFIPNATSISDTVGNFTKWLQDSRDEVQKADDDALNEIKSGVMDWIDSI